jgi:hypothetical protein
MTTLLPLDHIRAMSIEFLFICILAAVISSLLTAFGCRVLHGRRCGTGWWLAAIAALCASFLAVLWIFGSDIFSLSAWWITSKDGIVLVCFLTIGSIAFIPSFLVLSYFRQRFCN